MPNHCCNTLVMLKETLPVILKEYIGKNGQGESIMDFFTAWSPPIPIIKKLAELHKELQ